MFPALALASLLAAAAAAPAPAPAPEAIPPGELGKSIRLGKALFDQTDAHPLTRPYVKNALTCASCHPSSGGEAGGATLVGAATAYPAWSPRERAVITLEDRILNCFMRSMNGLRPPNGSPPSVALAAYLTWISTGLPVGMNPRSPHGPRALKSLPVFPDEVNLPHGRVLFESKCAKCHGKDGEGNPPVWGPRSYNAGAGFADVEKLAAFVRVTMPLGDPTLTDSEAVDVAAYVNAQPRPDFRLSDHLPAGAIYNSAAGDERDGAPTWPPPELPPGVVDGETARALVAQGVQVLDVRTPREFQAGHLPGAVNIPLEQMASRYREIGPLSTQILIYCRTGRRSAAATKILREKGFTRIYDLQAYQRWREVETGGGR